MSEEATKAIVRIAQAAAAIGRQAGVGAMETAGAIVSYLAAHPEHVADFVEGKTSPIDWPWDWLEQGELTWLAKNGEIVSPEMARHARIIRKMEPRP